MDVTKALLVYAVMLPMVLGQGYGNGSGGAFAPVANVTLDTGANNGVFQFTNVHIPAGVTVRLVGANPARFLCQGNVTIAGTLDANGEGSVWVSGSQVEGQAGGPGGSAGGGWSLPGSGPGAGGSGWCSYPVTFGSSAAHATAAVRTNPCSAPAATYGTVLPFELAGGSGGAGAYPAGNQGDFGPLGTGGGGAVAIFAGGTIVVSGSILARGGDHVFSQQYLSPFLQPPVSTGGCGSGGAILLRALQCVRVSGHIDARGGGLVYSWLPNVLPAVWAGDGLIRIDSYSACGAPDLTGATIRPAQLTAAMPHLTALSTARIGQTYPVRCASAPGDVLGFYYSLGTAITPVPPFGVLELDPSLILFFGLHAVPTIGDDPLARIDMPIPSFPSLVGITFHAQVFNAFGTITGQARLSNRLVVTIQN